MRKAFAYAATELPRMAAHSRLRNKKTRPKPGSMEHHR